MATEVRHGPKPVWSRPVSGEFSCHIVGHYTDTPDLGAGGVVEHAFQSDRDAKIRAELLILRTAFCDWFVQQHIAHGGSADEALAQLQHVVDRMAGQLPKPPRWRRLMGALGRPLVLPVLLLILWTFSLHVRVNFMDSSLRDVVELMSLLVGQR